MPSNNDFVQRDYRRTFGGGLKWFTVRQDQSDLAVGARMGLPRQAEAALRDARAAIEAEIALIPAFLTSFAPLTARPGAPDVVAWMYEAAQTADVGPMAAVAGAVAQAVGRSLLAHSPEVIVENGGDLYIAGVSPRSVAVFAGDSPLSMKLAVRVPPGEWGVCTSAGRVGPSVSLGCADAAMILSHDAALSDAAATALGNRLHTAADIPAALEHALGIPGVLGALAVMGDQIGAAGMIELVPAG